jgi:hypothetical protein
MNSTDTECQVQLLLHNIDLLGFYPPHSKWIHCESTTYFPHSNECGPQTLIALTLMATHPNPGNCNFKTIDPS